MSTTTSSKNREPLSGFVWPDWVEKAKELRKSGKTLSQTAKIVGVSSPSVSTYTGPKAILYAIRAALETNWRTYLGCEITDKHVPISEIEELVKKNPWLPEAIMDRMFEVAKSYDNGTYRTGLQIKCTKRIAKDCLKSEAFHYSGSARPSPVHAARVFRNHGWVVGGSPKTDVCPKCMEQISNLRRDKPEPTTTLVKKEPEMPAPTIPAPRTQTFVKPVVKPGQITLKDIDRESRRAIDMKLEEVYEADKGGYLENWTDALVAKDLGCLEEWVSIVRDFGHGPNTSASNIVHDVSALNELADKVMDAKRLVDIAIDRMASADELVNKRLTEFEALNTEFQRQFIQTKKMAESLKG